MPARIGYFIIAVGIGLAIVGLLVVLRVKVPWFGRLPGDIHIERDGTHFYFPIVTCLVVSLILTALATLLFLLLRRH